MLGVGDVEDGVAGISVLGVEAGDMEDGVVGTRML